MKPFAGCRFEFTDQLARARLARRLRRHAQPLLVLDTCQRLECYGEQLPEVADHTAAEAWDSGAAFVRLVRIAAGLESRILGELEVLGQLRQAYKCFRARHGCGAGLDRLIEDAIALGRRARKQSGIDRHVTSLSALAARALLDRAAPGLPLAVIGSGSIAASAARYLSKRGSSAVRIASRCPENAVELALKIGGFGAGLDQLGDQLRGVGGILCATAAPHPVLYAHHLAHHLAHHPLGSEREVSIVDLGEPPDCSDEVTELEQVNYLGLLDIEAMASVNTDQRKACAQVAEQIIRGGADVRGVGVFSDSVEAVGAAGCRQ